MPLDVPAPSLPTVKRMRAFRHSDEMTTEETDHHWCRSLITYVFLNLPVSMISYLLSYQTLFSDHVDEMLTDSFSPQRSAMCHSPFSAHDFLYIYKPQLSRLCSFWQHGPQAQHCWLKGHSSLKTYPLFCTNLLLTNRCSLSQPTWYQSTLVSPVPCAVDLIYCSLEPHPFFLSST